MEKVIITGANGFIGSHLTDFLISNDFDVYALDLPDKPFIRLYHYTNGKVNFTFEEKLEAFGKRIQVPTNIANLKILECDMKNAKLLEKIIQEVKPKYIFHFGAQPFIQPSLDNPTETIETNVIGTINIFEPIKKNNINTRVITACTAAEFGTTALINRPLKENDPLLAVNPYGISKIVVELLTRQYYLNFGIEAVNLRFFNQIGPRQVGVAPTDFITQIVKINLGIIESTIQVGNLSSYRDFTGIKDTIQAIWLAATKGKPGETYHVCSNKKVQIRRILDIALRFASKKIKIIENTSEKLRKTDEDTILGDNSKIKKELGWKITQSIEDILKEIYDYWLDYYSNIRN